MNGGLDIGIFFILLPFIAYSWFRDRRDRRA